MKRQDPPPGSSSSNGSSGSGASRHRRGEVGFDKWLKVKLHQVYDPVLAEKVPDDLMELLQAFDTRPPEKGQQD